MYIHTVCIFYSAKSQIIQYILLFASKPVHTFVFISHMYIYMYVCTVRIHSLCVHWVAITTYKVISNFSMVM